MSEDERDELMATLTTVTCQVLEDHDFAVVVSNLLTGTFSFRGHKAYYEFEGVLSTGDMRMMRSEEGRCLMFSESSGHSLGRSETIKMLDAMKSAMTDEHDLLSLRYFRALFDGTPEQDLPDW